MRGHIKSRSPGSWSIVLSLGQGPDGKPRQRWSTVHGTKKDAGRELTRLLKSQDEGAYVEPSKLSLGAYLSRWLADYATPRCSPKTVERWAEMVRLNITPAIGHHALSKLTRLDIQILYSELSKKLAAQTVLHVHRLLFQALRQAVKWDLLVRNPAEAVTPPHPKRTEMKVLKGAQMAALLDMTKASRLHVPIVLAVTCGMRRGEILALKWSDVDLEGGKLHVAESLEETKAGLRVKSTKSGRGRQVPMMAMTVAALHRQLRQAHEAAGTATCDLPRTPALTRKPGTEQWRASQDNV
jgi:integrase